MSEFDRFGHDYRDRLKGSISGLASLETALNSKLQLLRRLVGDQRNNADFKVLDFGCGTGLLSGALGKLSSHVTGADVSMESLRNAGHGTNGFVLFNGRELPFTDDFFALVVASCVFHHIPPASRPEILQEIRRVLAPGGILAVIEHNPYNPVTRFVVNRCEFDEHAELITLSGMKQLLEDGRFSNFRHGYFYAVPPLNQALAYIDSHLSRIPLGAQYYCAYRKLH